MIGNTCNNSKSDDWAGVQLQVITEEPQFPPICVVIDRRVLDLGSRPPQ